MKLKNIFVAVLMLMYPALIACGQHIIIDPDGYTNVREKPNASAKILGAYTEEDIFFSVGFFPEDDSITFADTPNWLAVHFKGSATDVGYVYLPKVMDLFNLPELKFRVQDSLNVHFFDTETKISIQLQSITKSKFVKKGVDSEGSYSRLVLKDGNNHYPYFANGGSYAIESVMIEYLNEKKNVDTSLFYDIFLLNNPLNRLFTNEVYNNETYIEFKVYKGRGSIYYIVLPVGDGGESNIIIWIIRDGKIIGREII